MVWTIIAIYLTSVIVARNIVLYTNTKYLEISHLTQQDVLRCITPVFNTVFIISIIACIIIMESDKFKFPKWFTHPNTKKE